MAGSDSNDPDWVDGIGKDIEYAFGLRDLPAADGVWIAAWIKNIIRENRKGEQLYVKAESRRHLYADKIKAEFDGTNLAEVMERYGVSRATVYRIARD